MPTENTHPKSMDEAMENENLEKVITILTDMQQQLHGLMGDEFELVTIMHRKHKKGDCEGLGIVTRMMDPVEIASMLVGALSAMAQKPTEITAGQTKH